MTGTRGQCSHHSFQLAKVGVQQGHFGTACAVKNEAVRKDPSHLGPVKLLLRVCGLDGPFPVC